MVVDKGILVKMGERFPELAIFTNLPPTCLFETCFWVDVVTWILSIVYHQQMRPDIKSDVFHLNWAPESVPADEVLVTTDISHVKVTQ